MKKVTYLLLGTAAIALAGCNQLPNSSLGATFSAERYLESEHGGPGFNGALAQEYTELGRRAAFRDVRWRNSTAYIAKAQQAESGVEPPLWTPEQLGVNGDAAALYQEVATVINANKAARPEACARAQAMWDQYLEALRADAAGAICLLPADAKALLDEALAACGAAPAQAANFIVYFGFDRTNLTDRARQTLDEVVQAVQSMGATALSVVGHADTVGSVEYNQGLSEARARRVGEGLVERGIPGGAMTLAGRSELQPAVQTGDGVREPLNRRVEITLSQ
jgi:outer membrane protein OmpA-like peptidoglycan-associated protein